MQTFVLVLIFILPMNFPSSAVLLFPFLAPLFISSCNSNRSAPREVQLEQQAETLEAKADQVLEEVKVNAKTKDQQAEKIRETTGDVESAKVLEKDADVTREVGKLRAEQLEKQAAEIRSKTE